MRAYTFEPNPSHSAKNIGFKDPTKVLLDSVKCSLGGCVIFDWIYDRESNAIVCAQTRNPVTWHACWSKFMLFRITWEEMQHDGGRQPDEDADDTGVSNDTGGVSNDTGVTFDWVPPADTRHVQERPFEETQDNVLYSRGLAAAQMTPPFLR